MNVNGLRNTGSWWTMSHESSMIVGRGRTMLGFGSGRGCTVWLRRLSGTGMAAVADCL